MPTSNQSAKAHVLAERAARCLNQRATAWRPVSGGYSSAIRIIVTYGDGKTVFVKGAANRLTADWLRIEYGIYSRLQAPFLPVMHAWEDDGSSPFLVLEDLSGAVWQPPWTAARIAQLLDAMHQVAATTPPAFLPGLQEKWSALPGWTQVMEEPAPFLRLGLCSADWSAKNIPVLVSAEADADLAGKDLVHGDIRSDNLCFAGDTVKIVDWNWACRGNGAFDLAAWLPSLHLEGGPLPDSILPGHAQLAARVSGYFAAVAGLPAEQASAKIRAIQLAQLRVAMPWAARTLGLAPPV